MIHLDRDSDVSLIDQIVLQLAGLIQDGQLPPGTRLPSIRKLASTLAVSTATVVGAYDRLTARALIESRAASGYFVSSQRQPRPRAMRPLPPRPEHDAVWLLEQFMQRQDKLLHVGSGFLPESWLEDMLSSRLLARVARHGKRCYALPGAPQGYPPLREQLALKLGLAGIPASPEQLLLTIGATHAFDLICRGLLSPGDTVAVEEPAYFNLFAQLRSHGVKLVGVPRLANGPDVDALAAICSAHRPRLFVTQTLLHNPTGGSTDAGTAFRLLELAHRHDFLIVEDDIIGDLHPSPNPLRLAQVDRLERVILVGSFTKLISPSIRVGYLAAAPELLRIFLEQKMLSVLNSSEFDERLVLELLVSGRYRKHIERIRSRLAHYRAQATRGLANAGLRPALDADGGPFIWAALPPGIDLHALSEDAAANGFLLTPGDVFFLHPPAEPWLRFNAAAANEPRLFAYLKSRLAALTNSPENSLQQ
jgi:DNA-binding transcriptional MocR family regulator